MKTKNRNYSVSEMIRDYEKDETKKNKLTFDFAVQRPANQWNNEQKSLLIDSILNGIVIPDVFIYQNNNDGFSPMTVLDGKQRCTTIYDFCKNGWKLSRKTRDIVIERACLDKQGKAMKDENGITITEKQVYSISGKFFKQLPDFLQEEILAYELGVKLIYEATNEELTEQMFRLNNGKTATTTQKSIMKLGLSKSTGIKALTENELFKDHINITDKGYTKSDDMKYIMNTLTVLCGLSYKSLSNSMNKSAEYFKENLTDAQIENCNHLFSTLNELLDDDIMESILTTNNLPVFVMNVDCFEGLKDDNLITEAQYRIFINNFMRNLNNNIEWQQNCGKNISDKNAVEARITIMEDKLHKFVSSGCKISA